MLLVTEFGIHVFCFLPFFEKDQIGVARQSEVHLFIIYRSLMHASGLLFHCLVGALGAVLTSSIGFVSQKLIASREFVPSTSGLSLVLCYLSLIQNEAARNTVIALLSEL